MNSLPPSVLVKSMFGISFETLLFRVNTRTHQCSEGLESVQILGAATIIIPIAHLFKETLYTEYRNEMLYFD